MKVAIVIDSFKGSLSSMQVGKATKEGVLSIYPQADVIIKPLADGGEGTVYVLADGMNGELKTAKVTGPLGDTVKAHYALLPQLYWKWHKLQGYQWYHIVCTTPD